MFKSKHPEPPIASIENKSNCVENVLLSEGVKLSQGRLHSGIVCNADVESFDLFLTDIEPIVLEAIM